ncbi:Methylase of polypeptide chain release factors [Mycobacterium basiliense]|uniref:Methylase of polypeptide chain release factors n=1 Tax=Mycobacterium basiliense TaxID=2094119 RepID=A0A3S4BIZ4_9MYCO|nr:class I SAM-dependent methyltransferase [Mycobacterium basiliense]VDM90738.1 Methylase of polypeptide chain release factors [Mycobacterium basiliense]
MTLTVVPSLAEDPDRVRWNEKYSRAVRHRGANFTTGEWMGDILEFFTPTGDVLELACGRSGAALALAELGCQVTAVDVSDVALGELDAEATRRNVAERLHLVHANLSDWVPTKDRFALVMCRFFWDRAVFQRACTMVLPGGLVAWEATVGDNMREAWRPKPGEPASLLTSDFTLLRQVDIASDAHASRRMIASRAGEAS